ncbi:hypothetical protein PANT_14d00063 [Moesziomyces antarcticus T-34]|uniref:Transcription factor TFIIIC triple barrel domain-containing protein n=1 Tax=Pseudozyma antarctica (strain T-34) TaxID=1151754 RepID=M9LQY0_PSEA3|nr:hypothetical protein PANT_14d00063 [Moesziomyces antarcticus T-34]
MSQQPLIDSSWHRAPDDTFSDRPHPQTPFDPSSSASGAVSDDGGSDWSYSDTEELVVLDLGEERIARRALLGYSAGLDVESDNAPTTSRAVRGTRAGDIDKRTKRATSSSTTSRRSTTGPHLGAGKMLAITGLDTSHPLLKIDDTVLRGRRMDMFGTEIVLRDQFDPTRTSEQHRLEPLPPVGRGQRATTRSSTTRTRLVFRPIYDPEQRETANDNTHYAALRNLVQSDKLVVETVAEEEQSMLARLQGTPAPAEAAEGRGKRKPISEPEQLIRAAERQVRRAAKLRQQQEQNEQSAQAPTDAPPDAPPDPSTAHQS